MNRESTSKADMLRRLPSVEIVLQRLTDSIGRGGHRQVTDAVRAELSRLRDRISRGSADDEPPSIAIEDIVGAVNDALLEQNRPTMVPVFNLTGTVLHTNLGRAILPPQAMQAVVSATGAPCNLEFDLASGRRGDRDSHVADLVCELTGAEAATVVNNNAAAVLLVLNTLALDREVPVSRGELVEIGGSFRIPEVMQRSGCKLVEIGATNRTHLKDYENAITPATALLMKVHTSNYRIEGFTKEVSAQELAALARRHRLPFVIDLGSGSLIDFKPLGLPAEPTAAEAIADGADLITFSGDKLLGGPQCGIIAGRGDLLKDIRRNHLKRALRLDKMTLVALAEVLKMYRNPDTLLEQLPTLRYLSRPAADIRAQAEQVLSPLQQALPASYEVAVIDSFSQIGSGALPVETIPSAALAITSAHAEDNDLRHLADALRRLPRPVIGRIHNGALLLDLRCLENQEGFIGQLDRLQELLG